MVAIQFAREVGATPPNYCILSYLDGERDVEECLLRAKFKLRAQPTAALVSLSMLNRVKLRLKHLQVTVLTVLIIWAILLLAIGTRALFYPALHLFLAVVVCNSAVPYILGTSGLLREETIQRWHPYVAYLFFWLMVALTGGLDSCLIGLLWAATVIPAVTAPSVALDFRPIGLWISSGYTLLFLFSMFGNPFPQLALPDPRLLRYLQNMGALFSVLSRISGFRQLAAAAIEVEVDASNAKSRFIAVASHEMRTPLTAILGWTELLLKKSPTLGGEDRRTIETIQACGRTLLSVINNILDYSKLEKGDVTIERTPFHLSELIHDVYESNRVLVHPTVNFKLVQLGETPPALVGDPFRLSQVLNNIISNAAKFTEHGEIELTVSSSEPLHRVVTVTFSVRDTGIGMGQDTLEHLFRPFMQADTTITRRFGGTGLGMVITKQLIEAMGGRLEVQSRKGVGTTISWSLHLALAPSSRRISRSNEGDPLGNAKVLEGVRFLLVDDNKFNQALVSKVLASDGGDVQVANHGAEALAIVQAKGQLFDLILMDIQMPIMDGITATYELRKRGSTVPIVGLTANADDATRQEALKAGMDDLLTKPIPLAALRNAALRFKAGRSHENSPQVLRPKTPSS